jgi:hypothetical protein
MPTRLAQLPTKTPRDYTPDVGLSSLSRRLTGNAVPDCPSQFKVPVTRTAGKWSPGPSSLGTKEAGQRGKGVRERGGLRMGCPQEGVKEVSMERREEAVGGVVNLVHTLSPDVPQEGAQGPLASAAGGAQVLFERVTVVREGVQGSESPEGVPEASAPEPGAGGGGRSLGGDRDQAAKCGEEYGKEGG